MNSTVSMDSDHRLVVLTTKCQVKNAKPTTKSKRVDVQTNLDIQIQCEKCLQRTTQLIGRFQARSNLFRSQTINQSTAVGHRDQVILGGHTRT